MVLLLLSVISDIRLYKIKNIIIYSFITVGLLTNWLLCNRQGLMLSLWGMTVPVLCLMILYLLRVMGAGDIKLFCAIGSIMGADFAVNTIIYSFLAGGVGAILIILARNNGKERLVHLVNYVAACFLTRSFLPYCDFEDKHDNGIFHFAVSIAAGSVTAIFMQSGVL